MIDQQIEIPTKDGHTTTFITHPERGGPFPVIIFYMDAPAIREELRDMARRLGTSGYYVMLPNLYYRAGVMELGPLSGRSGIAGTQAHVRPDELARHPDGHGGHQRAARLCRGPEAPRNTAIVGTVGYCMSGRYAINAATHFPDRVKAAASIYGMHLATDQPDSPHLAAQKTKAELYFACAETDIYAPQEIIDKVKQAHDGRQRGGRDLSRHPSRLRLSQAPGL